MATPFLFTLHFSHCVAQAARPSAQVGLCSLEHLPSHDAPLTQHDEMPFQFTLHDETDCTIWRTNDAKIAVEG